MTMHYRVQRTCDVQVKREEPVLPSWVAPHSFPQSRRGHPWSNDNNSLWRGVASVTLVWLVSVIHYCVRAGVTPFLQSKQLSHPPELKESGKCGVDSSAIQQKKRGC